MIQSICFFYMKVQKGEIKGFRVVVMINVVAVIGLHLCYGRKLGKSVTFEVLYPNHSWIVFPRQRGYSNPPFVSVCIEDGFGEHPFFCFIYQGNVFLQFSVQIVSDEFGCIPWHEVDAVMLFIQLERPYLSVFSGTVSH